MKINILRLWIIIASLVFAASMLGCPKQQPADTSGETGQTAAGDTAPQGSFILTILHTNDTHARILPFNSHGNTCTEEDLATEGECFGGVARRATVIKYMRQQKANTLLVDAGDQFQGTIFYTQYRGLEAQTFMNMLGYDAMTLGNHEFDDGPEGLANFAQGLNFPIVSINVDVSAEPLLNNLIVPYTIKEIDGNKVGIFGLTTEDVPQVAKPGPNVVFKSIEDSARAAVAELGNQGVNIIIALSHSGLGNDLDIAAKVDGIDVIVGGHTHSLLSNTDPDAVGLYPIEVETPSGDPALVVTAKSWGMYLGNLDVTFNPEGVATSWAGEPLILDSSIPEDPDVKAVVDQMNAEVAPLSNVKVGETTVDLAGEEEVCRHYESNLGNLITDALRWETQEAGVQIGLFNGGGIRSGIRAGDITYTNVLEVLPFGDTLATFDITGADLRAALEHGVSRAEDPLNEGTGRFLQVSGMRYSWNPALPVGQRLVTAELKNEDGTYTNIVDDQIYKVATLLYIREGGDGYSILLEKAIDPYDFGRVIADILMDYLEQYSPISPQVEGRITRVE